MLRGTIQDITDGKRAEDALRESEERFRVTFEEAPIGMVIGVGDGVIAKANRALCHMSGYSQEELVGRHVRDLAYPEDRELSDPLVKGLLAGEIPRFTLEKRYLRKDGHFFWAQATTALAYAPNGEAAFALGVVEDITERKRAEESLRESEEQFRTLAEAVPQIVWATRPDGWNIYFNQRWVDYTGLTLEESYGHGWNTPFHPDDKQRAWEAWQRATQHNEPYSLECRLRRADGVYRWWLIRGTPDAQCEWRGSEMVWHLHRY